MKKNQSLAGFIRERLDAIEQRLSVGIRQEVIVAELIAEGYDTTTIKSFRTLLSRARKQRETAQKVEVKPATKQPAKTETKAVKKPETPLTKKPGFEFKGSASEDELI